MTKRRSYNTRGRRLLRMLKETGPRNRNVCLGIAGEQTFERLRVDGKLKTISSRRGRKYGAAA